MLKKQISAENTEPQSEAPMDTVGSSVDEYSENVSSSTNAVSVDNALIGESIRITGDVAGNEDLIIYGGVSGSISLPNNIITIGKQASIDAHVIANSVDIEGEVSGTVHASDAVRVKPSGCMSGDIAAPRVALEDGCQFRGDIDMQEQTAAGKNERTDKAAKPGDFIESAKKSQEQHKNENAENKY